MEFRRRTHALPLIALTGALALSLAAPAHAGSRSKPAPIVFAGKGAATETPAAAPRQPAQQAVAEPAAGQGRVVDGPGGKRIEFRYPDQPNTYYGNSGARIDTGADPMVFSSERSAVSAEDARQFAAVTAPVHSTRPAQRDPALTEGGFDARAAAAKIEQAAVRNPIETTPMPAAPITPAPQPRADGLPSGVAFSPIADPALDQSGFATWYGDDFHGAPTANGEVFDMNALTAAHPTLPLPSLVQVVNIENGREIIVRVNDRGPFNGVAAIEVSKAAAAALGFEDQDKARVKIRYLGAAEPLVQADAPEQGGATVLAALEDVDFAAPPPAHAAPAPQPIQAAAGHHFIQVGSFSDIANAQALHQALGAGMPVEIVPARVRGADYFRVFVGPLDSEGAAAALRDHLDERGIANGIVVER